MSGKTVLILGGGIGGMVAASELRRLLPTEHQVALVEKNPKHAFPPSFLWLMTGDRQPDQITQDVRRLVRSGVEVILAEVQSIDLSNRSVQTNAQTLNYDYLIIALGAELAIDAIPGLAESAHTYYTFDGSMKLRDTLRNFAGGKVAVVVSALPYKCPGAPHEGAMLIANMLRKRGLQDSEVHLFTPEPQPMPVAGPALGEAVKQMLADRGVAFHPLHKLNQVNPDARELAFDGKDSFHYDLLVAIPPHRGPRLARESGLANEAGWIPVDRATLQTKHENVFAIGDATAIQIPGRWKPDVPMMLPKAGVFAHAQAEVVARRIAAEIAGVKTEDMFCGDGYCMLEAGEDVAGFAFGDFFAEPSPQIQLRQMGWTWHVGKVLFEQWWLAPYGLRREVLKQALHFGGRALGIPMM
ncbi:MAG: FAD/NAD(P)-binding oxidoreductase [Anaerolineales bacterium]|jgi:sulfide:quinone oxidoreductase|nr:FAD/NAD(P)-binding oxidoreductase [Anaerolineales bacterium]